VTQPAFSSHHELQARHARPRHRRGRHDAAAPGRPDPRRASPRPTSLAGRGCTSSRRLADRFRSIVRAPGSRSRASEARCPNVRTSRRTRWISGQPLAALLGTRSVLLRSSFGSSREHVRRGGAFGDRRSGSGYRTTAVWTVCRPRGARRRIERGSCPAVQLGQTGRGPGRPRAPACAAVRSACSVGGPT